MPGWPVYGLLNNVTAIISGWRSRSEGLLVVSCNYLTTSCGLSACVCCHVFVCSRSLNPAFAGSVLDPLATSRSPSFPQSGGAQWKSISTFRRASTSNLSGRAVHGSKPVFSRMRGLRHDKCQDQARSSADTRRAHAGSSILMPECCSKVCSEFHMQISAGRVRKAWAAEVF